MQDEYEYRLARMEKWHKCYIDSNDIQRPWSDDGFVEFEYNGEVYYVHYDCTFRFYGVIDEWFKDIRIDELNLLEVVQYDENLNPIPAMTGRDFQIWFERDVVDEDIETAIREGNYTLV